MIGYHLFKDGLGSITRGFVSLQAPGNLMFNFMSGLSSIIVPFVIGYLAKDVSVTSLVLFLGILAFTGMLSCCFLADSVCNRDQENSNFKLTYNGPVF